MAAPRAQASLNKFLTLLPETHLENTNTADSAILDSRSGSQTDLSNTTAAAAEEAAKSIRSDSTTSTASTVSDKDPAAGSQVGSAGFLKLGN